MHASLAALWLLVAISPVLFGPESHLTHRLNQRAVTQRLVALGFSEEQSRDTVAKLPADQVAKLAGTLGDPSGLWLLTAACFAALSTFGWFFLLVL